MNETRASLLPDDIDRWVTEHEATLMKVAPSIADWTRRYLLGHCEHTRSIIENVRRISETGDIESVVDVGAVPGHVSAMLKRAGFNVHAVDLAPERAKGLFQALEIPYHRVNVEHERLPLADDRCDLVLFCEVLEHMRSAPFHVLGEIRRVLRNGGHLLLSTPQISPLMRWRFLWGENFQDDLVTEFAKLDSIGHMGHFRLYSQDEVVRVLTHVGFEVVGIETGGKLKAHDRRWDARLLRRLVPDRMRAQIYVHAIK